MYTELPIAIFCIVLTLMIILSLLRGQKKEQPDLDELAKQLLDELDSITNLPIEQRFDAKQKWNDKFDNYRERGGIDIPRDFKIKAVK
ncbi:hypothetical protein N474_25570 [Pseudoalteromonas luteoviolacea CPMOR-2]|uniref:hypothetical protein n=1 Tax=Pseudoalteromonas luteoviolacea TaxID=43657 RepID=UPI0007B168E3|nr:hypothetical protein [Pseudoalteromonas luteoviolacea]KZN58422.1 hypothetical protein N474_25570 [Pseudoalteromonas luteoviolacea CPMOR-2]